MNSAFTSAPKACSTVLETSDDCTFENLRHGLAVSLVRLRWQRRRQHRGPNLCPDRGPGQSPALERQKLIVILISSETLGRRSAPAQRLEDFLTTAAIRLVAQALLFSPNRLARFVAQHAVNGADVVAAHRQQALQFAPLGA